LAKLIKDLTDKKAAIEAEKKDVDNVILKLTDDYKGIETKYTKYGVPN